MPAIAAPADRRFRRAHVKPAKKRWAGWAYLWLAIRLAVVVSLVAYGGWRGSALLLGAPAMQVSRVTVTGHERLAAGEVLALVDGLTGRHILTVALDEWRDRVLASPWVADATLRRVLPSTIEIAVREREPIGIGRIRQRLYLVDAAGVVVDEYGPKYADLDLPLVDGLAAGPADPGGVVDELRARLAARLLAALAARPDLARQVSQIDVSDVRDAVVMLEGDPARLRLGDRDFVDRLQEYIDLAPALKAQIPEIDYVDLRFEQRLYVRPIAEVRQRR